MSAKVEFKLETSAFNKKIKQLDKQVVFATSKALNTAAFKVHAELKGDMQAMFQGGATRFTLAAFKVEKATKTDLSSAVVLRDDGFGKGGNFRRQLQHLVRGGTRNTKRFEAAFRRIGVLPMGYIIVPGQACPLDMFGNVPPQFIVKLLSYFKAFGEQGYRANMADKTRHKMANRKAASIVGGQYKSYATIQGVEYFLSSGKRDSRQNHLPAGIWSRSGTHGSDVKPVLMFVRMGRWDRMIDLNVYRQKAHKIFNHEFDGALKDALRTAR